MKLDFCRQTTTQMTYLLDLELKRDRSAPSVFRPLVVIGHTKDFVETDTLEFFLKYLKEARVRVAAFREVYDMILKAEGDE